MEAIAALLVQSVNDTVLSALGGSAFLTSCHQHCGQWAQGQTGLHADFSPVIDGYTQMQVGWCWADCAHVPFLP